jgi:hypothetical protein
MIDPAQGAQGSTAAGRALPDPPAPGESSGLGADWPAQAADAVESLVAAVNDRAIRPLLIGARAVVFGMLIGVLALITLVVGSVAILRILDVYVFNGRVWASYLLLGALFSVGGIAAWSRRRPSPSSGRR